MNWIYSVIPYVSVSLLVAGCIYRLSARDESPRSRLRDLPPTLAIPLLFGGVVLAAGPILGFLAPKLVRAWISSPAWLLTLESVRLIGGMMFAYALAQLLRVELVERGAGQRVVSRTIATALLLFLTASGLYLAVNVRWSSAWYVEVVVPYLRSLGAFDPDVSAFAAAPLTLRLHVLGVFALLAAWPFARWTSDLIALLRTPRTPGALDANAPPLSP